jgi:hypothetical protein
MAFVLFLVILILPRLAIRLRESGMKVMELANKKHQIRSLLPVTDLFISKF